MLKLLPVMYCKALRLKLQILLKCSVVSVVFTDCVPPINMLQHRNERLTWFLGHQWLARGDVT